MDNWNTPPPSKKNLFLNWSLYIETLLFVFAEILLTLAMKNNHVMKSDLTTKELKMIGA